MCGLVSVLTKRNTGFNHNEMKIFRQMLFADALRGMDSTGVFGVNKFGSVSVAKEAVASPLFLDSKGYEAWDTEMFQDGKFMVGHNRAATKGKVEDQNAHPFTEGHITLVHNGTLFYHKELADVEVDSHAICKSIAERGYKETLKMIDGAFALIWFDMKLNKLFITRNSKRPLSMAWSKDKQSIYISSESMLIPWITSRNGETVDKLLTFTEETKQDVGTLFTVDLDTCTLRKEEVDFYKPKYTAVTNYKSYPAWVNGYVDDDDEWNQCREHLKTQETKKPETKTPVVVVEDPIKPLQQQNQSGGTGNVVPFGNRGSMPSLAGVHFREIITKNVIRDDQLHNSDFWQTGNKDIVFDYEDSVADGIGHALMGLFKGISVDCYISTDEELDKLVKYPTFRAEVKNTHYLNDKLIRIEVTNVRAHLYKFTKNGESINSKRWEQIYTSMYCDECHTEVGINEIEDTIIRFDKATQLPRRVVCGCCIEQKSTKYKEAVH